MLRSTSPTPTTTTTSSHDFSPVRSTYDNDSFLSSSSGSTRSSRTMETNTNINTIMNNSNNTNTNSQWKKAATRTSTQPLASIGSASTAPLLSSNQQPQPIYSTASAMPTTNSQSQKRHRHRYANSATNLNSSHHSLNSGGLGIAAGLSGYPSPAASASSTFSSYTNYRRRAQHTPPYSMANPHYRWLPWVMKTILASPMVATILYLIAWISKGFRPIQRTNSNNVMEPSNYYSASQKAKARMLHERHKLALQQEHQHKHHNVRQQKQQSQPQQQIDNYQQLQQQSQPQQLAHTNRNQKQRNNHGKNNKKHKEQSFIERHFQRATSSGNNDGSGNNNNIINDIDNNNGGQNGAYFVQQPQATMDGGSRYTYQKPVYGMSNEGQDATHFVQQPQATMGGGSGYTYQKTVYGMSNEGQDATYFVQQPQLNMAGDSERNNPAYSQGNPDSTGLESPLLYTSSSNNINGQAPPLAMQSNSGATGDDNINSSSNNSENIYSPPQLIPLMTSNQRLQKQTNGRDENGEPKFIPLMGSSSTFNTDYNEQMQAPLPPQGSVLVQPKQLSRGGSNNENSSNEKRPSFFNRFRKEQKTQPQGRSRNHHNKKNQHDQGNTAESVVQRVFYYDPHAVPAEHNGQQPLPAFVYDQEGNAVLLSNLLSNTNNDADVFYEPPDPMQINQHRRAMGVPMPNQQMSFKEMKYNIPNSAAAWGESPVQDQSIIVVTVAVMALLVGALSARRLRKSKSLLAACIENEALVDDEVTFFDDQKDEKGRNSQWGENHVIRSNLLHDTSQNGTTAFSSDNYHTFYKGDLEKFDV